MDDINIKIIRNGICMGDDIYEHLLILSLKQYDSIDIESLIQIIDLWLIKLEEVIWTISLGKKVLGTIEIRNGTHTIRVYVQKPLCQLDFSIPVYCRHNYIR